LTDKALFFSSHSIQLKTHSACVLVAGTHIGSFLLALLSIAVSAKMSPIINFANDWIRMDQRWANSVLRTEYEYEYYSSSKKWPNTNIIRLSKTDRIRTRILFRLPKMTKYEYEYYSAFQKWPNTNTNIIRLSKNDRIRTRILFDFLKMTEHKQYFFVLAQQCIVKGAFIFLPSGSDYPLKLSNVSHMEFFLQRHRPGKQQRHVHNMHKATFGTWRDNLCSSESSEEKYTLCVCLKKHSITNRNIICLKKSL